MKRTRCIFFALLLLYVTATAVAEPPEIHIKAPTSPVKPGDLILLDGSASKGDHFKWVVDVSDVQVPNGTDTTKAYEMAKQLRSLGFEVQEPTDPAGPMLYLVINNGKGLVTASYVGKWRITFAASSNEGIDLKTTTVVVKGDVPTEPKPDPTPDPDPSPGPVFDLDKEVPKWLSKVANSAISQKNLLADAYQKVGLAAINGDYATIEEAETAAGKAVLALVTEQRLDSNAWSPFGEDLNLAFTGLRSLGKISTAKDYGYALLEISKGLR